MNLSHAAIKSAALAKLGNNKWGEAIGVTIIFMLITGIASAIPFVGTIGSVLIGGPLALGLAGYFLKVNRSEQVTLSNLFDGFQNFGNSFVVALLTSLLAVGIFMVCLIPIGIVMFLGFGGSEFVQNIEHIKNGSETPFVLLFAIILAVFVIMIPIIIIMIGFSQAYRIMHDDPRISATDALRKSWSLMKNYKMDYFIFNLSFIGWALLCIITIGLGFFALYPYIQASNAAYYDILSNKRNEEIDSIGEDILPKL